MISGNNFTGDNATIVGSADVNLTVRHSDLDFAGDLVSYIGATGAIDCLFVSGNRDILNKSCSRNVLVPSGP